MANVKILVLSDGETWETWQPWLSKAKILEITPEAFEQICNGAEPNDLEDSDIVGTTYIAEAP